MPSGPVWIALFLSVTTPRPKTSAPPVVDCPTLGSVERVNEAMVDGGGAVFLTAQRKPGGQYRFTYEVSWRGTQRLRKPRLWPCFKNILIVTHWIWLENLGVAGVSDVVHIPHYKKVPAYQSHLYCTTSATFEFWSSRTLICKKSCSIREEQDWAGNRGVLEIAMIESLYALQCWSWVPSRYSVCSWCCWAAFACLSSIFCCGLF